MTSRPNDLLRRLGYVRWGPPDFPLPADLVGSDGIVREPARHEVLGAIASPEPETDPADRDDDRLATELFRRYGSVERGLFRTRDHWVADAAAVRELLLAERIVEVMAHGGAPDPETRAAIWNEGFDEAWRQRDEDDQRDDRALQLVSIVTVLVVGAIALCSVRIVQRLRGVR